MKTTPNSPSSAITNYIPKPLLRTLSQENFCRIPIRIDLISAYPQTEFHLCPVSKSIANSLNSNSSLSAGTNNTVSASAKWKGGMKNMKASSAKLDFQLASALKIQEKGLTGGTAGTVSVKSTDSEGRNWMLQPDLHSPSLRFSLLFQDVNKIPGNHLRYHSGYSSLYESVFSSPMSIIIRWTIIFFSLLLGLFNGGPSWSDDLRDGEVFEMIKNSLNL